jgi:tetratricopeptide (TPR) repeat protein
VSLKDAHKIDFIKKLYEKKDYISVIKKANRDLTNSNIYNSEILLYKIRALDKVLEDRNKFDYSFSDLQFSCNQFIENYPSHKDLTEVYFYKIKSLFKQGKSKKAILLTNDLVKNFPSDRYAEKASILKAKNLYRKVSSRGISYKILKDILFNTKYVDNALKSATLLVENNLKDKNIDNAKLYLNKIIKYKEYIKKNKKSFYNYAKNFANLKDYTDAVKIVSILIDYDKDEEMLKNLSFWQEKANMSDLAYKNYKIYLKNFPEGRFVDFIKERMDKVLINVNENNSSKKIQDIDKVINNYSSEPIYKKALIEKVKLFIKEEKYSAVLDMAEKLKDINETSYIDKSAQKLLNDYLSSENCTKAIMIVDKYKVTVDEEKLFKLGSCYFQTARYKDSLELSTKYIKSKSFNNYYKWYYLAIKSSSKLKNWNLAIKLYEDLTKIMDVKNIKFDIQYEVFFAYMGLKYIDKALSITKLLEDLDINNPKLLDIYSRLLKYYRDKREDLFIVMYAKKILKLQKTNKIDTFSPLVDIYLIKSLDKLNRYKEALKYFADAYLSKNINDLQKAQLLYLAGEISLKNKNIKQAREFFLKCGTDVKNKNWQKLCSESLKLIEDK